MSLRAPAFLKLLTLCLLKCIKGLVSENPSVVNVLRYLPIFADFFVDINIFLTSCDNFAIRA